MADAVPGGETIGGVNANLLEPLERAAGTGDAGLTVTLLADGATADTDGDGRPLQRTVLHWAAFGGNPAVVSAVLNAGGASSLEAFCVTEDTHGNVGTRPLHLAAAGGHVAAAMVLIAAGATIDVPDALERTPLDLAAERGHEAMVEELIRAGANIGAALHLAPETPLHSAAYNGHPAIVRMLLQEGMHVNLRDQAELTALHLAAMSGHTDVIAELVNAGANPNAPDMNGMVPLHSAVGCAEPAATITALVNAGADPHSYCNAEMYSPLHITALENRVEALSVMLGLGVKVDDNRVYRPSRGCSSFSTGPDGATLLHLAAASLSEGAVEVLLSNGADDRAVQSDGRRPGDVVGIWAREGPGMSSADIERRTAFVTRALDDAAFIRRDWLSMLRARCEIGQLVVLPRKRQLQHYREVLRLAREEGEGAEGGDADAEDDGMVVLLGVAVWLATVSEGGIFREVLTYL